MSLTSDPRGKKRVFNAWLSQGVVLCAWTAGYGDLPVSVGDAGVKQLSSIQTSDCDLIVISNVFLFYINGLRM